jgi:hypothetical protein
MNIGYLLLSRSVEDYIPTNYEGVFRMGAFRRMPISSKNQKEFEVWLQSANYLNDFGFIEDLDIAKSVLIKFQNLGYSYDLVACIDVSGEDNHDVIKHPSEFLGYDIGDINLYSIIYEYGYAENKFQVNSKQENLILRKLSLDYFSQKLNLRTLFDSYELAKELVEIETIIAKISPNANTLHIENFKIFKLYKLLI